MKKLILLNSLFLLLFSCNNEVDMIVCKGFPDVNQSFSYMYFKTENEGYLFGDYYEIEKLSEKELEDPNTIPKVTYEANIYKTTDGGKNWVKINSRLNYTYTRRVTQLNDDIYIFQCSMKDDSKINIVNFSIKKGDVENYINAEKISAIWNNGNKVFYISKDNSIKIYPLDKNNNLDSIDNRNYDLQGLSITEGLCINNKLYAIFFNYENQTRCFGSIDEENKEIKLSIKPFEMVKQDENTILIAGGTLTDEISLISYDLNTQQSRTIKEFKNYSIVDNLQSNDKAIVGLIGNIKGFFVEYDLFYSLDKGKTWQIQELKNPYYVHPICLMNNIVYIYSGAPFMQKIVLL